MYKVVSYAFMYSQLS